MLDFSLTEHFRQCQTFLSLCPGHLTHCPLDRNLMCLLNLVILYLRDILLSSLLLPGFSSNSLLLYSLLLSCKIKITYKMRRQLALLCSIAMGG